jgi:hypothetical protein
MKMTKIALAVATLLASTQAFAVPVTPADITNARVAGTLQQAWISGASAPTKSVYEGWVGSGTGVGCDLNSNSIFTTQSSTSTATTPGSLGNFTAYACTRGGVVSVLYHTLDGGSLNFVTPATIGTRLARVKFPGAPSAALTALFPTAPAHVNTCVQSTVAAQATYTDSTNTENNAAIYKSCTQAGVALPANAVATPATNASNNTAMLNDPWAVSWPVGGFSDVEPAILPATLGGGDALVNAKGVATAAGFGQVFGVVVSRPLYRALQVAQGIAANTDALDPNFDPVNAPNITHQQYVAIATQGGAYQTDWSPLVGAAGTGRKVILARRVNSSGTQASSTAFFMENPCAGGSSLTPAAAADSNANFEVFEGSGTGNVKTRITTATNSVGTDNFAIGVVSAENNWRVESATGGQNGYRFVKVDGVHPEAPAARSLVGATAAQITALSAEATANARATAAWTDYKFHMEGYNFVRNDGLAGIPNKTAFEAGIVGSINAALVNPPTAAACNVLPRGLTLNPAAGSICDVGGAGNTTFATVEVANGTNFGDSCKPIQATQ